MPASKAFSLVLLVLAAATTLCAVGILTPNMWIAALPWVLVPYTVLQIVTVIPWRADPPPTYTVPTESLSGGIFWGDAFTGGLAETTPRYGFATMGASKPADELEFDGADVVWDPPRRRGFLSRVLGRA